MDLVVRQKVFSLKERFFITTPEEENVYQVEGKAVSISHRLMIYDMMGNELANMHRKVFSLTHRYFICHGEEEVAELRQKFGLHLHFVCEELGWEMTGNFLQYEFAITKGEKTIATVHRKMFSIGDCYLLHVENDDDALNALCMVLAIDDVLQDVTNATIASEGSAAVTASAAST